MGRCTVRWRQQQRSSCQQQQHPALSPTSKTVWLLPKIQHPGLLGQREAAQASQPCGQEEGAEEVRPPRARAPGLHLPGLPTGSHPPSLKLSGAARQLGISEPPCHRKVSTSCGPACWAQGTSSLIRTICRRPLRTLDHAMFTNFYQF